MDDNYLNQSPHPKKNVFLYYRSYRNYTLHTYLVNIFKLNYGGLFLILGSQKLRPSRL